MKKLLSVVMVMVLMMSLFTGCTSPMAQYQKDVEEAELIAVMQDIIDEKADIDDLLDEMDFDNIVPEDMVAGFDSSEMNDATNQVTDFLETVDSALDLLSDLEAGDDEVEELHENLIEALEGYDDIYATIPSMMDYLVGVGESFEVVMKKAMGVEMELTPHFMSMSTEFSVDFMANQSALEDAMANLEGMDFGEMETAEDLEKVMIDSQAAVMDINATIDMINDFNAVNESDKAIQEGFVELLQSLVDMIGVAFADPTTMMALQEFAAESDNVQANLDEYDELVDEWMEAVEAE